MNRPRSWHVGHLLVGIIGAASLFVVSLMGWARIFHSSLPPGQVIEDAALVAIIEEECPQDDAVARASGTRALLAQMDTENATVTAFTAAVRERAGSLVLDDVPTEAWLEDWDLLASQRALWIEARRIRPEAVDLPLPVPAGAGRGISSRMSRAMPSCEVPDSVWDDFTD